MYRPFNLSEAISEKWSNALYWSETLSAIILFVNMVQMEKIQIETSLRVTLRIYLHAHHNFSDTDIP